MVSNVAKRLLAACHRANKTLKGKVISTTAGLIFERRTQKDSLKEGDSLYLYGAGGD